MTHDPSLPRPASREMSLSGWGGVGSSSAQVFRPARQRELRACLGASMSVEMIPRGLGRSYGDSATLSSGNVVLSERLNRFLAFDAEHGLLTCESGISFAKIVAAVVPQGYFLPVTPGTKFVSLGGAIAADVHGKNHQVHGSLGNFVVDFVIWTGGNELLHCSRDENADLFWATIGGMGLTGYIVQATLQLTSIETSSVRVDYKQLPDLDALLAASLDLEEKSTYSVAWVDCVAKGAKLGKSVLMCGEHATCDELPPLLRKNPLQIPETRTKSVPFNFPGFALNRYSVAAFNKLYYLTHPTRQGEIESFDSFFYPLDTINNWNRIYGRRGFIQYQALLSLETAGEGIQRLLEEIVRAGNASFLAVLKRTGEANSGMLSFCRPGITLALDLPNTGHRLQELVTKLDQIVSDYDGRLYFAKDSMSSPDTFKSMYSRLDEFREVRRRYDPDGRFVSDQAKRLGIV